jgi:flagellar basal-body rod protein FlgC
MNLFANFDISASALTAQRIKMDVISSNLSNIDTTNTAMDSNGAPRPYRKKVVALGEKSDDPSMKSLREFKDYLAPFKKGQAFRGRGVEVASVLEDESAVRTAYMPGHPDADGKGYVTFPDINIIDEMVEMIKSSRIYEANLTAFNEAKSIFQKSLEIGKV